MGQAASSELTICWRPQPGPQAALIKCPVDEIFFGGARGGGKTDGMLGKFAVKAAKYGKDCVGVFFRRTREDLKEAIERSASIYGPLGAVWHEQKKSWRFPNGARLKFEYLDNDKDAQNYQGHNYTDLFFEELTNWPDPAPINKLRATLRSPVGVPCQFHATGNPGGPGHQWVRARYIDPDPRGWKILPEDFTNPFTGEVVRVNRVFIPSRLTENRFLGNDYIARLQMSGSRELVRAWLEGDWSVVEGAYFDNFNTAKHVCRPFEIPDHWLRFRAGDWGSARPFAFGWFAVAGEDTIIGPGRVLPKGALVMYREWYGVKLDEQGAFIPNTGLKLTAEVVGNGVRKRDGSDVISYGVLDPAAFAQDGGPSIAERMMKGVPALGGGSTFRPADNKRVAQRGAMGGWDQVRGRLEGDEEGRPMLVFFETCIHALRTLPALQHDQDRLEDVDTDAEDHAPDMIRYGCMSRPWTRPEPKPKPKPMERGQVYLPGPPAPRSKTRIRL